MKKILIGFFVAALCVVTSQAMAFDTSVQEYSYEIRNTTTAAKAHVIPTTSIRPGVDKITRFELTMVDSSKGVEMFVAIFDDTDEFMTGEMLGEKEASTAGESVGQSWARGRKIINGVTTWQGSNTDLIIWFIRE